MALRGAALGRGQIIGAVDLVDMRPFGPHRLVLRADAAVYDDLARPDERTGLQVEALNPDRAMPLIARRAFGRPVVDQPRAAVRIDEQRRVDPVEIEPVRRGRSEEHTSELQSLMRNSYA